MPRDAPAYRIWQYTHENGFSYDDAAGQQPTSGKNPTVVPLQSLVPSRLYENSGHMVARSPRQIGGWVSRATNGYRH